MCSQLIYFPRELIRTPPLRQHRKFKVCGSTGGSARAGERGATPRPPPQPKPGPIRHRGRLPRLCTSQHPTHQAVRLAAVRTGEAGGGPRAGRRRLHVASACGGACKRVGEVMAGIIHRHGWAVDRRARGGRCPRRWVGPRYVKGHTLRPHAVATKVVAALARARFPSTPRRREKYSRDHSRAPARRTLEHSSPQPAATADADARSSGESCTRSRRTIRVQIGRAVRYGLRASCSSVGPPLRPAPRAAATPRRASFALSAFTVDVSWTCVDMFMP